MLDNEIKKDNEINIKDNIVNMQNQIDAEEIGDDKRLLDALLDVRKNLIDNFPIKTLVISALLTNSNTPSVVFDGEELNYTQLSVAVAKEFKRRLMSKIDI